MGSPARQARPSALARSVCEDVSENSSLPRGFQGYDALAGTAFDALAGTACSRVVDKAWIPLACARKLPALAAGEAKVVLIGQRAVTLQVEYLVLPPATPQIYHIF